MNFIIGLRNYWVKNSQILRRIFLLLLIIIDVLLFTLINDPISISALTKTFFQNQRELVSDTFQKLKIDENSLSPSASPEGKYELSNIETNNESEKENGEDNSGLEEVASSATPSPTANNSDDQVSSPTPTPIPSATPTPTPTPTPSNTPTPLPSSTPEQVTSPVYITGYVYANNQQLIAEQYPVKVINQQSGETMFSGETGNDGKSPTWLVPANTAISVYLYPKQGFGGCGDVWSFTTGNLGTMESQNLSIQADRDPCITL